MIMLIPCKSLYSSIVWGLLTLFSVFWMHPYHEMAFFNATNPVLMCFNFCNSFRKNWKEELIGNNRGIIVIEINIV